jgi:uncharacterized membrane protein
MSDYRPTEPSPVPALRAAAYADIGESLRRGWADFRRVPLQALFFGSVYALAGIAMYLLLSTYQQPWMIIPIAIGFPLAGPFLAAGLYETSRRLHAGETLTARGTLGFMMRQGRREFAWMAFVVLFIFWMWMYQARILIALFLDMQAFDSVGALATAVFTTSNGLTMIALGTVTGGILALILFTSTVVAMPLLVERDLDVVTALVTSWKAVLASPGPMLLWAALIGGTTFLSMIPLFLGLLVSFPLLGFATWHLYNAMKN